MKIVYDNIIFELQNAGGISKYWAKLIEFFSKTPEVDLIAIEEKNNQHNVFYPSNTKLKVQKDSPLPLHLRRYLPVFINFDFDIFHSSYYRIPFFSDRSLKQVVTVHDFMYEYFDSGLKKHIHIWQKKKAMFHADAIICVSEHTKKDLMELYPEVNPNKLYVVPNGVDNEFSKLKKIGETINIGDLSLITSKYLLYVGSRVGCKNFEFVLKMMNSSAFVKDNHLRLVCVGGGMFSKHEKNIIKSYGLSQNIDQVLYVDNKKLNYLYNGAYALIFPSKYEGFGIPALEAQLAGCPVIYARSSSLPEVMGYDSLGYELDNLMEASTNLSSLEDKKIRAQIVKKGIEHASRLSWNNSAKLTLDVYKLVLQNG